VLPPHQLKISLKIPMDSPPHPIGLDYRAKGANASAPFVPQAMAANRSVPRPALLREGCSHSGCGRFTTTSMVPAAIGIGLSFDQPSATPAFWAFAHA
ncbi:MAG: hypothetical protein J0H65_04450, partial [Rhizobiales bacterium]|nr:hypothetical protein [Hyphomicrobiales bacterium]